MAKEKRLGEFDRLYRRVEGEMLNGEPAFAAAVFVAATDNGAFCLIASGSYNYAISTDMQTTPASYKGAYFILDIGGLPASGTLGWYLDVRNPCNGEFSALAQGAVIPATGSVATPRKYLVYPGAVDTDSLLTAVKQVPLPYEWRCRVLTGGGSGTWAYSLGVQYAD